MAADFATWYSRAFTRTFCNKFRWPKQKGFALTRYGESEAAALAKEWVRRGNHFAHFGFESGCADDFCFDSEGAHAYPESLEFLDWCVTIDTESHVWEKICEVRASLPK